MPNNFIDTFSAVDESYHFRGSPQYSRNLPSHAHVAHNIGKNNAFSSPFVSPYKYHNYADSSFLNAENAYFRGNVASGDAFVPLYSHSSSSLAKAPTLAVAPPHRFNSPLKRLPAYSFVAHPMPFVSKDVGVGQLSPNSPAFIPSSSQSAISSVGRTSSLIGSNGDLILESGSNYSPSFSHASSGTNLTTTPFIELTPSESNHSSVSFNTTTEGPSFPTSVCTYYTKSVNGIGQGCLRVNCKFFHGSEEKLAELRKKQKHHEMTFFGSSSFGSRSISSAASECSLGNDDKVAGAVGDANFIHALVSEVDESCPRRLRMVKDDELGNKKPIVCLNYLTDACYRPGCRFLHLPTNVRPLPMTVCDYFKNGSCTRKRCRFFHGSQELLSKMHAQGVTMYNPTTNEPHDPSASLDELMLLQERTTVPLSAGVGSQVVGLPSAETAAITTTGGTPQSRRAKAPRRRQHGNNQVTSIPTPFSASGSVSPSHQGGALFDAPCVPTPLDHCHISRDLPASIPPTRGDATTIILHNNESKNNIEGKLSPPPEEFTIVAPGGHVPEGLLRALMQHNPKAHFNVTLSTNGGSSALSTQNASTVTAVVAGNNDGVTESNTSHMFASYECPQWGVLE